MKYLAVDIVQEVFTTVYLQVPDDFNPADVSRAPFRPRLKQAVEMLDSFDWSKDPEWTTGSSRIVPEAEARMYDVFEIAP